MAEATLGHFLHIFGVPGLAGFFMFPLGLWILIQVFKNSGRRFTVLTTALVASMIKLSDLALPGTAPLAVLNPALAILLESLVAVAILPDPSRAEKALRWPRLMGMAVSWRILYALSFLIMGRLYPVESFMDLGWERLLSFIGLESVGNSLLLLFFLQKRFPVIAALPERSRRREWSLLSAALFLASVLLNMAIKN